MNKIQLSNGDIHDVELHLPEGDYGNGFLYNGELKKDYLEKNCSPYLYVTKEQLLEYRDTKLVYYKYDSNINKTRFDIAPSIYCKIKFD